MKTFMLLAAVALASAQAAPESESAPKPKLRPVTGVAASLHIPIPKPRPRPDPAAPQQEKASPPPTPAEAEEWSAAETSQAQQDCERLLRGLDIAFAPLDPIGGPGQCGAPAPISVSRVAGVALTPAATLTCDMAAALHGWVSGTLKPAARERLRTEVTSIGTATSYACRRRNNASSGKMSEHARANALDMSGFSFAEREKGVSVGGGNWGEDIVAVPGVSRDGSFLEAVRRGACQHFTTVLGPGSDRYHGDHFHVDVLRRKNDYRICQ